MTNTSSLNSIFGATYKETAMLDFDNVTFKTVMYWALRAMHWFKLEGFIVLKSSNRNYHVVFNRRVTWAENMHIVAWVALLSRKKSCDAWLKMQCIKQSSTLRVSSKGDKYSPRIVHRHGKQDGQVDSFLRFRRQTKRIRKRLARQLSEQQGTPTMEVKVIDQ